jgi:hypothetical protein
MLNYQKIIFSLILHQTFFIFYALALQNIIARYLVKLQAIGDSMPALCHN